jgi:putative redox protein
LLISNIVKFMLTSKVKYLGKLRTVLTHIRSGQEVITDAPVDNKGKGEAFSPTDLAATSLATCAITTMGIAADGRGIQLEIADAEVLKIMENNPRRIAGIDVKISLRILPDTAENRSILEEIGLNCPVARSLHPDVKQSMTFEYV